MEEMKNNFTKFRSMADSILAIVYAVMFEGGGLLVLKLLVHVFAV